MESSGGAHDAAAGGVAHDRLSDLPDSLLHSILSRLGSRQVVQTCVLSRRWRHLWRGARTIDLDDREFVSNATAEDRSAVAWLYEKENVYDRFEDFADNLLLRRVASGSGSASPPDTFRLCINERMARHTNHARWVRRGLRCSPAALDVRNRDGHCGIDFAAAAPGCPRLTTLRLDNLTLWDSFMERLDTLFPLLEELDLRDCSYSVARIASATLKHLAIDNCRQRFERERVVSIVAPRLATLRLAIPLYHDGSPLVHCAPCFTGYAVHGAPPPSLARASVRVVDTGRYLHYLPGLHYNRTNMAFLDSLRKLLGSLSGATFLKLSGLRSVVVEKKGYVSLAERFVSVPMLQATLDDDPVFGNLQTLILAECDLGDDLQTLRRFLQNTPVLETLHLQHCKLPNALQRKGGRNRPGVAPKLKLVEIQYKDDENLAGMPDEYQEEHARRVYKVLSDISQELQPTVQATRAE